jgi:AcrR family transcriptional regulator
MPRRTAAEAARTREDVVAAAREAFTRHGYGAASTAAIARAAGVTRGALYHHFPDKTELFRAVFQALEAELDATVRAAAFAAADGGDDGAGPFRARPAFEAGCRALLDFMVRPDYRQIAAVDAPAVLGVAEWHATDVAIGLRSLGGGLTALHRAGELADPPTRTLVLFVFGALTEAGLALARGDEGLTATAVMEELGRLLDRLGPSRA